jgi:hypothetical protein
MSRVVVTGVGLVTSLGVGARASWEGMLAGHDGIGEIPYFDTSAYKVHRGHVIREIPRETTPHEPACMAAAEAVEDAGLDVARIPAERAGSSSARSVVTRRPSKVLPVRPDHKERFSPAAAHVSASSILAALADLIGSGGPTCVRERVLLGNYALAAGVTWSGVVRWMRWCGRRRRLRPDRVHVLPQTVLSARAVPTVRPQSSRPDDR